MPIVIRLVTCVSELCCSQSSDDENTEFMGEGSPPEIPGNSEGDGGTGDRVRLTGGPQIELESGDKSRSNLQTAMQESVMAALIFGRVIQFYGSQALNDAFSSEIVREESEMRMEIAGGSGGNRGSVARAEELQISQIEEPQALFEQGESSGSTRGQRLESVRLVTSWFSPFAHSVAISLREKGVQYTVIEESVLNKNERTLNANPLSKRIPILVHRGKAISESRIIMEYIDEAWPGSPCTLLPKDPFERSAARYWSDYIDKKIAQMLLRHVAVNAKEVYATVNDALIGLNKAMTVISHGQSFFMGDRLGFVDIVFAPMIPWLQVLQRLDNFKIPDAKKCPRLHEWLSALQKHPSIRPSLEACSPKKLRAFIVQRFRGARK